MNVYKKIIPIVFIVFAANLLQAQVKFKLSQLADGKTYQVSLIPETTYASPLNITSTGQVTLKAPARGFEVDQLFNLQPGVIWEPNSFTESPDESPDFVYLSFGLISEGTRNLVYEAGVEIPLFAFTNFLDCEGDISLVDNHSDPFAFPNSRQVNIGNQITILGARGDAYVGNAEENKVACSGKLTDIERIDPVKINLTIFPNPAVNHTAVSFNWKKKGEPIRIGVLDLNGKTVQEKTILINQGENLLDINLERLAQGNYFIELIGEDWMITSDQFVKMSN